MTDTADMLQSYPATINLDKSQLAEAIDTLMTCSQACTACADACLSEDPDALPRLTRCIRDNLDCADVCDTALRVLSRHTGYGASVTRAVVVAAMQALRTCGDSCAEHRETHEHCEFCHQACRYTEQVLKDLLPHLEPSGETPSRPSEAAPQV